jgi:hypothetical protein
MKFGEKLVEAMTKKGITSPALADAMTAGGSPVSVHTIRNWRRCRNEPPKLVQDFALKVCAGA